MAALNNKRVSGKSGGSGDVGYTQAHLTHKGNGQTETVSLRKDHISCRVYGEIDSLNAALGKVKAHYGSKDGVYKTIEYTQDCIFNIGHMIFDTGHPPYEVNLSYLLGRYEKLIKQIEEQLGATEFIRYGADTIHADWGVLTTQIRRAESYFVEWVNIFPLGDAMVKEYELCLKLLNRMSKWTFAESRYYCHLNKITPRVWGEHVKSS
jgi:cob(I)alamin adenosyltransferase